MKPPLHERSQSPENFSIESSPGGDLGDSAVGDKRKRERERERERDGAIGSVIYEDMNNLRGSRDSNKGKRNKVDNDVSRAASAFFENPWLLRSMVLAERLDDSKPEVVNAQEAVVFSHAFGLEEVFATCQMAVTVSEHNIAEGEGEGEGEENDPLDPDGDPDLGDSTPGDRDRDRDRERDNLTNPPEDYLRLQARMELKVPLSFMAAFVQIKGSEWDQSSLIAKTLGRVHRGKYCHNMNRLLFDFVFTPQEVAGPAVNGGEGGGGVGVGSAMAVAATATDSNATTASSSSSSSSSSSVLVNSHGDKCDRHADGQDQDQGQGQDLRDSDSYYDPKDDFRDVQESSSSSSRTGLGNSATSKDTPHSDRDTEMEMDKDKDSPPMSPDITQSTPAVDARVPDTDLPDPLPVHTPIYSEGERWLLSAVKTAGPGGLTLDAVRAMYARKSARVKKNSGTGSSTSSSSSSSSNSSSSSSQEDVSSKTSDDFIQMGKKLASRNDIILDLGYGFHDLGLHCIETVEKNPVHFVHSSFSYLYYVSTGPDLFPGEGSCPWVSVGGTRNELFYRMLRSKVAGILSIRPGSSLRSLHAGFPQLSLAHLSVLVSTMAQEGLVVSRAPPVSTLLLGPFAKQSVCVPKNGYYLRL